jgi:AcrR family transcriptional regulator
MAKDSSARLSLMDVEAGPEPRATGRAALNARRREVVRRRLLDAARKVFEEMGYHPARVTDITGQAEVSHGLFYNYFDSKQDIFRELAREVDRKLLASMETYLDTSTGASPQERMRAAITSNFRQFREQARMMDVIAEAAHSDAEIDAARLALSRSEAARLTGAIRGLQRDGIAAADLDPEIAAVALGAMGWRFAERWFINGELDCEIEKGAEQFLKLVLNALGMSPQGPGPAAGPKRRGPAD